MTDFTFVTSNDHKVKTAEVMCRQFNVSFDRQNIDLVEVQAEDGKVIATGKALQAYETFQRPVVITDDNWLIPGLGGFPGPYMKHVNHWFTPDDFVRLTKDLEDRSIIMRHIIAYRDGDGEQIFSVDIPGILLKEARGSSVIPHFAIMSFDGGQHSVAEAEAASNGSAIAQLPNAWHAFCEWFTTR
jgi:inosine/xanthosine triphosphate pyrophosphatase family protein